MKKWILLGIALYVGIACTVYRFRHPALTETELLLRVPAALLWQRP